MTVSTENMTLAKEDILVRKISKGIVMDHLMPWSSLEVLRTLNLEEKKPKIPIIVALSVKSNKLHGFKDIIKINDGLLDSEQEEILTVTIPGATVNVIDDFVVINKKIIELPKEGQVFTNIIKCPNTFRCVTNKMPKDAKTEIKVVKYKSEPEKTYLRCSYCEQTFEFTVGRIQFLKSTRPFVITLKQEERESV